MKIKKYFFEVWKDIYGYEGLYQVSNYGRVKSVEKIVKGKSGSERLLKEMILKQREDKGGYLIVSLCKEGKVKLHKVHRLVAKAFIPNLENKPTVDHINGNKKFNVVWNLRWATYKEQQNFEDQDVKERQTKALTNHKAFSKAVLQIDKDTNEVIKEFPSLSQVYRETGFAQGNISKCCNGKYKQMYGYIWKYASAS